jgi:orotidine-5'-phosphate decarboxylase
MRPEERIIVALDVDSEESALSLISRLSGAVGAFKVGLELVNAVGIGVLDRLRGAGAGRIFYDCKLHDIPNTVAGAMRAACSHNPWMINVHGCGGRRMIRAAVDAASESGMPPLVIAVTLLTSLSQEEMQAELQIPMQARDYAVAIARIAQESGADGVVCSPREIGAIRAACGPSFLIVTPGIRPAGSESGDQRRIMTPSEAVQLRADYLVIGRPITAASDPKHAVQRIVEEIASIEASQA